MAMQKRLLKEALLTSYTSIPVATRTQNGLMEAKYVCYHQNPAMGEDTEGLWILGAFAQFIGLIVVSLGKMEKDIGADGCFLIRLYRDARDGSVRAKVKNLGKSDEAVPSISIYQKGDILALSRRRYWQCITLLSSIPFDQNITNQNGTDGFTKVSQVNY